MCGRLDQNHTLIEYIQALRWSGKQRLDSQAEASDNAPPGTGRPLIRIVDDQLVIDDYFWGYRADWAVGKVPVTINARLEKLTSRYWAPLLQSGRAIVPANGWYEWTGEKGNKQIWHVHLKSGEPLFLAALVADAPARRLAPEAGFAIVSADAEGGMVDIHDRRPITLSAHDARFWLDPALPSEQAARIVREMALGPEAFEWHEVHKDMRPPPASPRSAPRESAAASAQMELPL